MGGTPDFVAGVWYGYDQPKEIYYGLSGNPSGTLWKTVMSAVYDKLDSDQYKTKFEEPEGIVKRSYCPSCGKLRSGTGVYGWYDVNNLPGNCSGGHGYSTGGSSGSGSYGNSGSSGKTTTAADGENTTAAGGETTAAQKPQTSAPAEPKPTKADEGDGE